MNIQDLFWIAGIIIVVFGLIFHREVAALAAKLKVPRLFDWYLYAGGLLLFMWHLKPQTIGGIVYKLALIAVAAVVLYLLDRRLFPYARPNRFLDSFQTEANPDLRIAYLQAFGQATLRRALIVAAGMIAISGVL